VTTHVSPALIIGSSVHMTVTVAVRLCRGDVIHVMAFEDGVTVGDIWDTVTRYDCDFGSGSLLRDCDGHTIPAKNSVQIMGGSYTIDVAELSSVKYCHRKRQILRTSKANETFFGKTSNARTTFAEETTESLETTSNAVSTDTSLLCGGDPSLGILPSSETSPPSAASSRNDLALPELHTGGEESSS
jgi:hypothetical protein